MEERKPHREICSLCHEISRIGFWVPNKIWKAAVHYSQQNSIICLRCFTRLADERSVKWDLDIKFYPVSWLTHKEEILEKGAYLSAGFDKSEPKSNQLTTDIRKQANNKDIPENIIRRYLLDTCDIIDRKEAENKLIKAESEGLGSLLLDVQQDCITQKKECDKLQAKLKAKDEVLGIILRNIKAGAVTVYWVQDYIEQALKNGE